MVVVVRGSERVKGGGSVGWKRQKRESGRSGTWRRRGEKVREIDLKREKVRMEMKNS